MVQGFYGPTHWEREQAADAKREERRLDALIPTEAAEWDAEFLRLTGRRVQLTGVRAWSWVEEEAELLGLRSKPPTES